MATQCPHCNAANPDGKKFCGDCGAALADPLAANVRDAIDSSVATRVDAVLKERYKDQKLLEVETTQAIVERFSGWAKLLGFFVGVPVALLLLVLGLLGVKTYADFSAKVEKIESDTTASLSAAQENATKLKTTSEALANLPSCRRVSRTRARSRTNCRRFRTRSRRSTSNSISRRPRICPTR